jgi:ParB family chromosome partitioning protein
MDAIKKMPWTTLEQMKGDPEVLGKLDQAEELLRSLRKNLTA